MNRLRILAIEPFHGGSHKAFLEGLSSTSVHDWTLLTQPPANWKWRMRASALELAPEIDKLRGDFDLLFVSSYVDLACLLGLRPRLAPLARVIYFHENQLTYPVRRGDVRDIQFTVNHLTSIHCADEVWFNSRWHRDDFVHALNDFITRGPTRSGSRWARLDEGFGRIEPLGLPLSELDRHPRVREGELTILWNHRWEFDKAPERFYNALCRLDETGATFRLAVCGEKYADRPPAFDAIRERFDSRLIQFGWLESRADYEALLRRCDVVVSTAIHEFFGLSVIEAAYAGCHPLLPRRLSYPEIFPDPEHQPFFYRTDDELVEKLCTFAEDPVLTRNVSLQTHLGKYDWKIRRPELDEALARVAASKQRGLF